MARLIALILIGILMAGNASAKDIAKVLDVPSAPTPRNVRDIGKTAPDGFDGLRGAFGIPPGQPIPQEILDSITDVPPPGVSRPMQIEWPQVKQPGGPRHKNEWDK